MGTEEFPLIVKTIPFSLGTDKLPIVIKIEPVNGGSTSPIYVELTRSEVDKELEKQKVENDTKLVEYTK